MENLVGKTLTVDDSRREIIVGDSFFEAKVVAQADHELGLVLLTDTRSSYYWVALIMKTRGLGGRAILDKSKIHGICRMAKAYFCEDNWTMSAEAYLGSWKERTIGAADHVYYRKIIDIN